MLAIYAPPGLRLCVLATFFSAVSACVTVEQASTKPTPVTMVGAEGSVPAAGSKAILAEAVEDAPNPQAIKRLESLMETVSDEPLFKDNDVRLLVDGPETYAAMLAAIGSAMRHVHLESYIFNDDKVGKRFADALIKKSSEGVEVRVIYDALGSRESPPEFFDRMKKAGIELVEFHPVNPVEGGNPLSVNVRDHRKILVVDGDVAFTGGINLDRNYSSSSVARRRSKKNSGWRDTHIEVLGPAAAGFQRLFLANWKEGGGEIGGDERRFFPKTSARGSQLVRVLSAVGGERKVSPIRIAYGFAMEAAVQRIWLTQSYFGPDPEFLRIMTDAAKRGVDVRIIVTGFSDAPLLLNISRSCYSTLLNGGVHIYESSDVMLHAKTAVIDGVWSTVGSSNLDYRSFVHNYEVNAVVVGESFGSAMEGLFRKDLERSKAITLKSWNKRPYFDRVKEQLSRLFQYWL